jgi:hypothetical protein
MKEIAWKAQHRLYNRFKKLTARGKQRQQAITAVARELLGFMWAIAQRVQREQKEKSAPPVRKASPASTKEAVARKAKAAA